MRLQSAMASLVQSPGNVPFGVYRGFRNQVRQQDEPYRFVDGELVEGFADLAENVQEEVVNGLGVNVAVEEVRGVVESLRRLR